MNTDKQISNNYFLKSKNITNPSIFKLKNLFFYDNAYYIIQARSNHLISDLEDKKHFDKSLKDNSQNTKTISKSKTKKQIKLNNYNRNNNDNNSRTFKSFKFQESNNDDTENVKIDKFFNTSENLIDFKETKNDFNFNRNLKTESEILSIENSNILMQHQQINSRNKINNVFLKKDNNNNFFSPQINTEIDKLSPINNYVSPSNFFVQEDLKYSNTENNKSINKTGFKTSSFDFLNSNKSKIEVKTSFYNYKNGVKSLNLPKTPFSLNKTALKSFYNFNLNKKKSLTTKAQTKSINIPNKSNLSTKPTFKILGDAKKMQVPKYVKLDNFFDCTNPIKRIEQENSLISFTNLNIKSKKFFEKISKPKINPFDKIQYLLDNCDKIENQNIKIKNNIKNFKKKIKSYTLYKDPKSVYIKLK